MTRFDSTGLLTSQTYENVGKSDTEVYLTLLFVVIVVVVVVVVLLNSYPGHLAPALSVLKGRMRTYSLIALRLAVTLDFSSELASWPSILQCGVNERVSVQPPKAWRRSACKNPIA